MKHTLIPAILLPLLAGACSPKPAGPSGYEHVIILGFDGFAGAALDSTDRMPVLNDLMARGSWTTHKRSVLPTSSAVNWATMFMGAGPEAHGYIKWNSTVPHFTPAATGTGGMFPTVFTALRDQRPEAEAAVTYQWDGIKYVVDTTALSLHRQFPGTEEGIDEELAFVQSYIREKKPVLAAFTWDYPDHTGHTLGWYTPAYYDMLAHLDQVIGGVTDALEDAGIADRTLLIVTCDHGGHLTRHGDPVDSDLYGPFVAVGPGIRPGHEIEQPLYQYDIAATVAYALGLACPDAWRGRPTYEIFTSR